jgi:hypothetical protein
MVDTISAEQIAIPFRYSSDRVGSAFELLWHPEVDWLIATGDPTGASRWLNVTNADGSVSRNLGLTGSTFEASFGWLPDEEHRVDI